jgi:hypothetical protein
MIAPALGADMPLLRPTSHALAPTLVAVSLALAGCSSDTDHGEHDAGTPSPSPSTTTSSTPEAGTPVVLGAPTITGLPAMAGGIHVTWKNAQKDCDTIEGERKSASEAYKVVFSVPGSADNKHDGVGLVAGTPYTYRLRCKKGESASAYSDEKTGTP